MDGVLDNMDLNEEASPEGWRDKESETSKTQLC